ncbi:alpha,alpha-phosphotrehalase [Rothia sp. CCM 9418]|uniref:alpha,alpha-phosphotrehalase n=1 Tax=Rothia sp. CCM 9418 TaxID=3402661 RepID=UPI003AE7A708
MPWTERTIYQIYPKSFYDSNGDGIGDIRGIIEKIPYIASLGIDMVWFNPFFVSPQHDNGYDISDYYNIDPSMGTMEDVEELIQKLNAHNIDVMFDMVLNHVSTEHPWFQKALAGEKKYHDYFYIQAPQQDGSLPTNWESKFGGPAWESFGKTGLYYLHLYDKTQADLNWHNPNVREELFNIVNFWLNKGVRGLRFDVLNVIGKDKQLCDAPAGVVDKTLYTDTPQVHSWVKELHQKTFGPYQNVITVGEMSSTTIEHSIGYTEPSRDELSMVFSFHHLKADYDKGQKWTNTRFDFALLKETLNEWALRMQNGGGWNALFFNNHDQPRALNRFGDAQQYRQESATMLATVTHMLRGTPYIYQGEEIGMVDPTYSQINQYVDVEAHHAYQSLRAQGLSDVEAFNIVRTKARDNSRVPMAWDHSTYGGFSDVQPWLMPTHAQQINVAQEERDGRILPYYRKLIQLRKQYAVIARGTYAPYQLEHPDIYAFFREDHKHRMLVITNFYGKNSTISVPEEFSHAQILLNNREEEPQLTQSTITLEPYQALVLLYSHSADKEH